MHNGGGSWTIHKAQLLKKKKDKNLPEVWLGMYTGAYSEMYDMINFALDERQVREIEFSS